MKFLLGLTISQLKGRGCDHSLGGRAIGPRVIVEGSGLEWRGHVICRRLMNSPW